MFEKGIFLCPKLPINPMNITRVYKTISTLLSVFLCVSVLVSGLNYSFQNENNYIKQTTVSANSSHGLPVKIDEIFEEEETEKSLSDIWVNILPFVAGVVFLLAFLIVYIKQPVLTAVQANRPLRHIPIYITVENYRL